MHESSFIPTYDDFFKKTLVPEYQKATGIAVDYQLISVGSLQTRMATAAETGNGPDITLTFFNWPFLFDEKLVDVSDIAEEIGKKNGGWYDSAKEAVVVNGKWKAIPFGNVGQIMNWRTDWFAEVGVKDFPDTWDELLEAGIKLKKAGHPFGFELGHGFGDNHGWLYPLLWSYGAREVEPDGKTDRDRFRRDRARDRLLPQVLPGDDARGLPRLDRRQQQQGLDERADLLHQQCREHPVVRQEAVPRHRQGDRAVAESAGAEGALPHPRRRGATRSTTSRQNQQAAKDFLVWLMDPKQVERWYASADSYYAPFLHAYDDAPFWHVEPRNLPYRDSLKTSHLPGWPAPIGRPQSESVAKYVVVDMFAKACAGKSTKEVIADADAQLKQIYKPA